jgi:hypothetical protein
MYNLDPSYLRYIYDGLDKGALHPDNEAALPEGLIGLYEDAFSESKSVPERQKILETFAIWALLKREVSAQFVAEILKVPTQEIVDFIATYSSWFVSPESGKYQLYHERLKVYLLQKLSDQEIQIIDNKLISRLELAIAEQKEDEFELYGLKFLSIHYFSPAMIYGNGTKLIALSYDQSHWQRQQRLSKGFEWTKKGLRHVMNWASKFNDEEVIECGLQMLDLHQQEQNDAPQIVTLVAEGDIETALKRIEAFGGMDKEGLRRKFILYMLCLMELTLLDSEDKPFRKETIEKILKHFGENIPTNHSILNWNDFFPSYLVFLMACECAELGLDYLIVYDYAKGLEFDWIDDAARLNFNEEILLEITNKLALNNAKQENQNIQEKGIKIDSRSFLYSHHQSDLERIQFQKSQKLIAIEIARKGKINKALQYVEKNVTGWFQEVEKIEALTKISTEFYYQKKWGVVNSILSHVESKIIGSQKDVEKILMIKEYTEELTKQRDFRRVIDVMHFFIAAQSITQPDKYDMMDNLINLYNVAGQKGEFNQAISFAVLIPDDEIRQNELLQLYRTLLKEQKFIEAKRVLEIAQLEEDEVEIKEIGNPFTKGEPEDYQANSTKVITRDFIQDAIDNVELNRDDDDADYTLKELSFEAAINSWYDLLEIAVTKISNDKNRINCWREIANNIIRQNNGYTKVFDVLDNLRNTESKFHFKTFILRWMGKKVINPCDFEVSQDMVLKVLKNRVIEIEFLKHIVYAYAINEHLFGKISIDLLTRINRTLNIQWAIDIKNKLQN